MGRGPGVAVDWGVFLSETVGEGTYHTDDDVDVSSEGCGGLIGDEGNRIWRSDRASYNAAVRWIVNCIRDGKSRRGIIHAKI